MSTRQKTSIKAAAKEFLALKRIAVAGVSRTKKDAANLIYTTLRSRGYQVFALNPNAKTVEGDVCYAEIADIPGGVEAVVAATSPAVTEQVVNDSIVNKVKYVWMHKSIGDSVSEKAVEMCRENGIKVIPGGCPMMFSEPVDFGHVCMRGVLTLFGRVPNSV